MFRKINIDQTKDERLEEWRGRRKEVNALIRELGQYVGQGGAGEARAPHTMKTASGKVVQRGRGSFKTKTMYEKDMPKPSGSKPLLGGVRGAMDSGGAGSEPVQPGGGQGFPAGRERPSVQEGLPLTGIADPIMESFIAVHGMDTYETIRANVMNADQTQIQQMMADAAALPEESVTRIGLERLILVELNDRYETSDQPMQLGYNQIAGRQQKQQGIRNTILAEESGIAPETERATGTKEPVAAEAPIGEQKPAEQKPAATTPTPRPEKVPLPPMSHKRERRILYQTKGEDVMRESGMTDPEMSSYKVLGEGQTWSDELDGHEPGQVVSECGLGQHKHGDTWGGKCHPNEVNHRLYTSERMWDLEQRVRGFEKEVMDFNVLNSMNATTLRNRMSEMAGFEDVIDRTRDEIGGNQSIYGHMTMRLLDSKAKIGEYLLKRDTRYMEEFRVEITRGMESGDSTKVDAAFDKYNKLLKDKMFFNDPDVEASIIPAFDNKKNRKLVIGSNLALNVGQALAAGTLMKRARELLSERWRADGLDVQQVDQTLKNTIRNFYEEAIDEAKQDRDKDTLINALVNVESMLASTQSVIEHSIDRTTALQLKDRINDALLIAGAPPVSAAHTRTQALLTDMKAKNAKFTADMNAAITSDNKKEAWRVIGDMERRFGQLEYLNGVDQGGDPSEDNVNRFMELETEASDHMLKTIISYQDKWGEKPTEDTAAGSTYFTDERMANMSNRALWKIAQFMGWGGAYRSKPEIIADIKKGVNPAGYEKKVVKVGNFLEHFTKMDEEDVQATWAVAMQSGQNDWVQALESERDRRYAVRQLQNPNSSPPQWDKNLVNKMTPKKIVNLGGWAYIDSKDYAEIAQPFGSAPGTKPKQGTDFYFHNAVVHQHLIETYSTTMARSGKELMRLVRTGGRDVSIDRLGKSHDLWTPENKAKMRDFVQQNHVISIRNDGSESNPSYTIDAVNKYTGARISSATDVHFSSGGSYSSSGGPQLTRTSTGDEKRDIAKQSSWHWGTAWANPMYRGIGLTSDCFVMSIIQAERAAALKLAKAAGRAGTEDDIASFTRPLNMDSTMISIGSQKFSGPGNIIAATPEYLENHSKDYVTQWNRHAEHKAAHEKVLSAFESELHTISNVSQPSSTVIHDWHSRIKDWKDAYTSYLQESSVWGGQDVSSSSKPKVTRSAAYIGMVDKGITNIVGILLKLKDSPTGYSGLTPIEQKHVKLLSGSIDPDQVYEAQAAFIGEFNKRVDERLADVINKFRSGDSAGAADAFTLLKNSAFGAIVWKEHKNALKYEVLKDIKMVFADTGLERHLRRLTSSPNLPVGKVKADKEDIKALLETETYAAKTKKDDFWAPIEDQGEDDLSTIVDIPDNYPGLKDEPTWEGLNAICSSCQRSFPAAIAIAHGDPLCPRCASMLISSNTNQPRSQQLEDEIDGMERANGMTPPNKQENLDKLHQQFGDIPGAP